jgi:hypothetical protein
MITLLDINKNKEYGDFSVEKHGDVITRMYCQIRSNNCSSEEEWEMLVKPYMEE